MIESNETSIDSTIYRRLSDSQLQVLHEATLEILERTGIRILDERAVEIFKKGENYAKLGMSDKIMIDKRMEAKKAIIIKIAQRLLPKVRRAELIRLKNYKQKASPCVAFLLQILQRLIAKNLQIL